jgi:beta-xylosidase
VRRLGAVPDACRWPLSTSFTPDVKRYGRTTTAGASGASLRDFHNYLVTGERVDGEWSDPIYLNSSGSIPRSFTTTTGGSTW